MSVTIEDIKKLKAMTGAGIKDCKNALKEANGDFQKAVEVLRKKGQKILSSRAGKTAGEGVVALEIVNDGKKGVAIALNCETDFVANTDAFQNLAKEILNIAIEKDPQNLDELKELTKKVLEDTAVKIQEKLEISRYEKLEGDLVTYYLHHNKKIAALVALENVEDKALAEEIGKDLAMQVVAMKPIAVDRNDIPQEVLDKEREIAIELAKKEGKPENIIEKIAMGRVNKFISENTLLNQEFIKEDKKKVSKYLKEKAPNLKVKDFRLIEVKGE